MRWAAAALTALSLTACTEAPSDAAPALPSDPVCAADETPDSCLESVRLALQSAFTATAERGAVTHADYERIVGSVVSQERLGGSFSYALLSDLGDGVDDGDLAGPRQFRVSVSGAAGTWWMCPEQGRVQVEACA